MRHIIIGGGVAGTTAAEELRKLDRECEITLISEEHEPLYSRVLLPHYIKGKVPRERVFLKKETWYEEQGIEWLRGEIVESLDTTNKFVAVSNGRELPYDKLLIATGGDVRRLEGDLRGVSYFRTLADADHLLQLLGEGVKRAGVYGGRFIAFEYINIFSHFKIPTFVALRGKTFWSGVLLEESAKLLDAHVRKYGVEIIPEAHWQGVIGQKELSGCKTGKGDFACDVLGIGVGIEPDFSWVKKAGIVVDDGIKTDAHLATNVPDVYAAGDIAEYKDVIVGRHLRAGNWMSAMQQGRVVARNMLGKNETFELVSSYATNALGLEIIFVGDSSREHADEIKVVGSAKEGGVTQLFSRNGRLVGATIIGRNKDRQMITDAIRSRQKVASVEVS